VIKPCVFDANLAFSKFLSGFYGLSEPPVDATSISPLVLGRMPDKSGLTSLFLDFWVATDVLLGGKSPLVEFSYRYPIRFSSFWYNAVFSVFWVKPRLLKFFDYYNGFST